MSIAGIGLSAVPENDWSNHTHIIERGNRHRKRRPHSSPVRSTQEETGSSDVAIGHLLDIKRQPSPIRPVGDPRSLLDLARGDLSKHHSSTTNTRDPDTRSGTRAYFSPQPPMVPLRLVKRAAPSGRVSPAPFPPLCEKPASPILPLLLSAQDVMPDRPKHNPLKPSPEGLQKLVQVLPMTGGTVTASQSSNHDTMHTSTTSFGSSIESVTSAPPPLAACSTPPHQHPNQTMLPTPKQPTPVQKEPHTQDINAVLRKIAIQEPSQLANGENELENLMICNDNCEEPGEWLGVVRALRDSHVRLVLRQLRHIDRLNRALDRATRPLLGHTATIASQQ